LGDPVYGRVPPRIRPILAAHDFRRQALHAAELGFIHPVSGQEMRFTSEPPSDFRTILVEFSGNR